MPRIRTIKPGFFRSDDVAQLSYRARLTWIGLWTYVDDEGRGVDNARLIKGDLWALDDAVTWREVEDDLLELETAGRIVRYTIDGKRYLQVVNWDDHQVISKSTPSKLPPPDSTEPVTDEPEPLPIPEGSGSAPVAVTAGRGTGKRKRNREEEGEEEDGSVPAARGDTGTLPDRFDEFWQTYPRRADRPAALRAWTKALKTVDPELILTGARRYAADPNRDDQFTKHPGPWLNAEAWNDPPLPARRGSPPPGRPSRTDEIRDQRETARRNLQRLREGDHDGDTGSVPRPAVHALHG